MTEEEKINEQEKIDVQELLTEDTVEKDTSTSVPVTTSSDDKEHHIIDVPKTDIHFELDRSKSVTEQAKDLVGLAATSRAVEDEELVENITEKKKDELKTAADTSLKQEQVRSSETEKQLQTANYGIYEGIADLIGLKKPLPNKMLKALMFILIPLLIVYYTIVGFITGVINVTMDCVNAITERFAAFTKSARKVIIFVAMLVLIGVIFLVIKFFLNKYGIIDW